MEKINQLLDPQEKTKENLIKLYATVVSQKDRFRYDPKKMIFDLLPDKKILYFVFMPKKEYSISQSRHDFGRLEYSEHRFINFLKFTEFTDEEIKIVFEAHGTLTGADKLEAKQKGLETAGEMFKRGYRGKALGFIRSLSKPNVNLVPKKYQYTKEELSSFINSLMPPIDFNNTYNELKDALMLTEEEIESLYKESGAVLS